MTVSLHDANGVIATYDLGSDSYKTAAMDRVHDFALTEEGDRAYIAAGLHLRCLDLTSGRELWRFRPENLFGFLQSSPRAVAVTKNKYVWLCSDNGWMDLFRLDGEHVARFRANDTPNMVTQMHNGDWFAGTDGFGITVWEPEDRRRLHRLRSSARVYAIKAFPREDKVAVRTEMGVSIVDLFNGDTVRTFPVEPGLPFLDVSPDGCSILTGEGHGGAVYDRHGRRIAEFASPTRRVITAAFRPSDGAVIAGLGTGDVARIGLMPA